jgi:hypothetical protein
VSLCPDSASGRHSPENTSGRCDWCGLKIGYRPRPKRWARYGESIDALGRTDGTDPGVDIDPDEDDGRQLWWPGYVHTD